MARAIVIGAGPVGLATAMLLSRRGVEVIVLDRDEPAPDTPDRAWDAWERRSVAQFRQVHFLQPRGRALLEEHLPEVVTQLEAFGAVRFNLVEAAARLLPGGPGDVEFSRFETVTTCRRPVLEAAFAAAANATPGVEIRHRTAVAGLLTGLERLPGTPHVVGVKTADGEALEADVVVDAGGRRTPLPSLLEAVGARVPVEHGEDMGFVYNTQHYRGDRLPEVRGDVLAAAGSISILTLPGDNGHWAVTLYHLPADKPMRRVRAADTFERVVHALPLHAHWADGERVGEVLTMASTTNTTRQFVIDGAPCATGVVPVGDAWGFTNPSLGRGIALGVLHAVGVAAAVTDHLDDPALLAAAWNRATEEDSAPWHEATVQFDRVRGPEADAMRLGLPDPHDPADPATAIFRAFDSARHHDAEVLQWFGDQASCFDLPVDVAMRPGVLDRVLAVAAEHEPYRTPAPTRSELEALLA